MTGLELGVLLALLAGKKGRGNLPPETPGNATDDGIKLKARAMQAQAQAWRPYFVSQGATEQLADALCRWTGIESSGIATAQSSLGERGLLQTSHDAVTDGAITAAEWEAMISPATSQEEQARIALKLYHFWVMRAQKLVANWPGLTEDNAWYAKMYHQRPVDVRDAKMHGPARQMSKDLATRWAKDPKAMHRLRAANVVAFGTAVLP